MYHDNALVLSDVLDDQSGREQRRYSQIARHGADSSEKPSLQRHAKSSNVSQIQPWAPNCKLGIQSR
jgi:hypothetical protein